jgi:hypothetical protein
MLNSDDQIFVQQFLITIITQLPILSCLTSQNESILTLIIPLPTHNIDLTIILAGIKTIGEIRIGLDGSSSITEVLFPLTFFTIELTEIINRTDPLNSDDLPRYSGIWSSSFNQRTYTNITIEISESLFDVSNQQQPIARESEIIFRNLLFTIVLLELFGLLFLVIKFLINPLFNIIYRHLQRLSKRNQIHPIKDDSA